MADRPSFLFLITDQHRSDHTGFGGNEVVRTPHLDGIAARGVRFDRAIVANPICMPNRASIVTGRLPSVHGTRYNGISLDWGANTFVRELRRHGYRTGLVGKSHFQNMGTNRRAVERVFAGAPGGDSLRPAYHEGWDLYENQDRHRSERVAIPRDFYGFDEVDLTVNHSDMCSGHYYQWLLEQGADPGRLQGRENALSHEALWNQVWRTAVPEKLYPTRYVTSKSVDFIEQCARRPEQPFFLWCSFPDPHHPFTPPGRYFDLYDPEKIPLPPTFHDPHGDSMPHFRRMIADRGRQRGAMAPWAPTDAQLRECAAREYGMITMIDDGVGEILAALEGSGRAHDTVVIFTSDHGDMFGDHGVLLKAAMHYEGCVRVPLAISAPGRAPGTCRSLVSSLDLAQTVLDLAGLPAYYGMQGASLAPLLDDPSGSVRDHALVEEDQMFDMLGVGQPLRMRTLVTEDARLTLYQGVDHGELFELGRDPDEMTNLFARPEARDLRVHLTERLARLLMEYADASPRPTFMA